MNQAMEKLKVDEAEYSSLVKVLFGLESASVVSENSSDWPKDVKFFDKTLNDSQKDAVCFAVAAKEIALIHGPPGVSHVAFFRKQ